VKTVYSVISLSFLIILLLVTPVLGSSDWVKLGWNREGVYTYNKDSVKHRTKGIVLVWVKLVFNNEGREKYIQNKRNTVQSIGGYDKLSHSLFLEEIDCKKEKYLILYFTDYDTDGGVLYNSRSFFDKHKWEYIRPDTVMDTLLKKVCK